MDLDALRSIFLWVTIFNAGLLLLTWGVTALALDWVYAMHSRFYRINRETFNAVIYASIGVMKLIVLMFNLVPYLALVIVT